jgi:hypothetical protein
LIVRAGFKGDADKVGVGYWVDYLIVRAGFKENAIVIIRRVYLSEVRVIC